MPSNQEFDPACSSVPVPPVVLIRRGPPTAAMPRYYCDYCDTTLTHDSPSVRKQHNSGYKHKVNVRIYYHQLEQQETLRLIDQRIKEHLEQAAPFHPRHFESE